MEEEATDLEQVVETETPDTETEEGVETDEAEVDETEAEAEETDGDDEDEDQEEADEIEFDLGGGQKVTFKANATAKEIAEEAQRAFKAAEGNLTRKSQDVAERSKSIEAREGAVEKLMGLNNETLEVYSRGLRLREEIEQLSQQVADDRLWQSDPDRARRISDTLSRKQAEFHQTVNTVSQKEAELTQAQQAELARRRDEGAAVIEKQVPKFKAEKLPAVLDYAVNSLGLDRESAERDWAINPAMTIAAYKAMLYDNMQTEARKAKPKPAQAQPVKAAKSKGKATSGLDLVKDADKMSADEWMRRRNQQLAKKAS